MFAYATPTSCTHYIKAKSNQCCYKTLMITSLNFYVLLQLYVNPAEFNYSNETVAKAQFFRFCEIRR
jgi:hypothetical protein